MEKQILHQPRLAAFKTKLSQDTTRIGHPVTINASMITVPSNVRPKAHHTYNINTLRKSYPSVPKREHYPA